MSRSGRCSTLFWRQILESKWWWDVCSDQRCVPSLQCRLGEINTKAESEVKINQGSVTDCASITVRSDFCLLTTEASLTTGYIVSHRKKKEKRQQFCWVLMISATEDTFTFCQVVCDFLQNPLEGFKWKVTRGRCWPIIRLTDLLGWWFLELFKSCWIKCALIKKNGPSRNLNSCSHNG